MALTDEQAEDLIELVADTLPRGLAAHSVSEWLLPSLVRSRLSVTEKATFDGLVAAADPASVPALVAGAIAVAGIT
jgi:hypothetical protein